MNETTQSQISSIKQDIGFKILFRDIRDSIMRAFFEFENIDPIDKDYKWDPYDDWFPKVERFL